MFEIAIWYHGRIVYESQTNPTYVDGRFKRFNVEDRLSIDDFILFVREQYGIDSLTPMTIYYRLNMSSTFSVLVDISGCETLSNIMKGEMIHPFYIEFKAADAQAEAYSLFYRCIE